MRRTSVTSRSGGVGTRKAAFFSHCNRFMSTTLTLLFGVKVFQMYYSGMAQQIRVASCEAFHYLLQRRSRNSIVRPEIAPRIVVVIGAAQDDAMRVDGAPSPPTTTTIEEEDSRMDNFTGNLK